MQVIINLHSFKLVVISSKDFHIAQNETTLQFKKTSVSLLLLVCDFLKWASITCDTSFKRPWAQWTHVVRSFHTFQLAPS